MIKFVILINIDKIDIKQSILIPTRKRINNYFYKESSIVLGGFIFI